MMNDKRPLPMAGPAMTDRWERRGGDQEDGKDDPNDPPVSPCKCLKNRSFSHPFKEQSVTLVTGSAQRLSYPLTHQVSGMLLIILEVTLAKHEDSCVLAGDTLEALARKQFRHFG